MKKTILATTLLAAMGTAHAEVITFGDLQTDANYNIIADTEMGREYLRFDTFNMTYAETLSAVQAGGEYQGWSIADSNIADDFINALFSQSGENDCSVGADLESESCGRLTGWTDGDFGVSHNSTNDFFAYVQSEELNKSIGIVQIRSFGTVYDRFNWGDETDLDYHNNVGSNSINFLLYRDNVSHIGGFNVQAAEAQQSGSTSPESPEVSVPVPASGGLFLTALTLLGLKRKNKA